MKQIKNTHTISFIGKESTLDILESLNNTNIIVPKHLKAGEVNPEQCYMDSVSFEIYECAKKLYRQGVRTFLSGMSEGFEILCAETILKMRDEGYDIKLIVVIPYLNYAMELKCDMETLEKYVNVLSYADKVISTSDENIPESALICDSYLESMSNGIVCYSHYTNKHTQVVRIRTNLLLRECIELFGYNDQFDDSLWN